MQIVIWIVIILLAIFLIWLLRRWIRRILFIVILLCIAFFIYGLFSPSGASRLWYNVRTFPQRVTSWFSNQSFLDYDSYKIGVPSIGDDVDIDFNEEDVDEDFDFDDESNDGLIDEKDENYDEVVKKSDKKSNNKKVTIKSFPRITNFIEMPDLFSEEDVSNEDNSILTGYTRSDLIGIVDRYVNNNLDDDTDILVTIEYDDSRLDPSRIILKTQPKGEGGNGTVLNDSVLDLFISSQKVNSENIVVSVDDDFDEEDQDISINNDQYEKKEVSVNKETSVKKSSSNNLTQKEQREAEEIFSILF